MRRQQRPATQARSPPCRFHGCVEGEQVGREGDFLNDLHHALDLGRRAVDRAHGVSQLNNGLFGVGRVGVDVAGHAVGILGEVGIAPRLRRQLIQRADGRRQCFTLPGGAVCQLTGRGVDFLGSGVHLGGTGAESPRGITKDAGQKPRHHRREHGRPKQAGRHTTDGNPQQPLEATLQDRGRGLQRALCLGRASVRGGLLDRAQLMLRRGCALDPHAAHGEGADPGQQGCNHHGSAKTELTHGSLPLPVVDGCRVSVEFRSGRAQRLTPHADDSSASVGPRNNNAVGVFMHKDSPE